MYINNIFNGKNNTLIKFTSSCLLLLLIACHVDSLLAKPGDSVTETTVNYISEDIELTASCYLTGSESLIVFLPSVYAPLEDQETLTQEIGNNGLSACISNVFTDLFLPFEGKYYNNIPIEHMLALLDNVQRQTHKSIFFVAHGKGNRIAYKLAHLAIQAEQSSPVSGLILLSPNLLEETPAPGTDQQYMPLVDKNILPVFIFQPTYSPHHWHLDTLIDRIMQSGTYVRFQRLENARDGYALRENRTSKEQALREQASILFERAIQQLTERK